jgi:hypothetical protein
MLRRGCASEIQGSNGGPKTSAYLHSARPLHAALGNVGILHWIHGLGGHGGNPLAQPDKIRSSELPAGDIGTSIVVGTYRVAT